MPAMSRIADLTPSQAIKQLRCHAVAAGEAHVDRGAADVDAGHGRAAADGDAELGRALAQRAVERDVRKHVRERLALPGLAVEGQEDRPDPVLLARIGDHHLGDRLGLGGDAAPDVELFQHADRSGSHGRGAAVLLPDALRRRIDEQDLQLWRGVGDRHGRRQADIAGPGDDDVDALGSRLGCGFGHVGSLGGPVPNAKRPALVAGNLGAGPPPGNDLRGGGPRGRRIAWRRLTRAGRVGP